MLDVKPAPKLEVGLLPGGWKVEAFVPGRTLRLTLSGDRLGKELQRRALVLPMPLVFIALIVLGTWHTSWPMRLTAWPVLSQVR